MNVESLFSPFTYKNLTLKNRFVMAPMTRAFSADGVPSDDVAAYYKRRALGEVGLIITEGTVINRPASKNMKDIPNFYGEQALQGWQKVVTDVHQAHGKIAPQIWHVGNTKAGEWLPDAPLESPDTMSVTDIEDTIAAFAASAKNAKDLGFDAIELHGAHGYLIDQFFWKETNSRNDHFGGNTIKDRNSFAIEVVKAVRKAVGPEMVIILRVSQWKQQDYTVKIAYTPKELEEWIVPLAEAGVDIFHGSQRRYWEPEFEGSDLNFSGWIKKVSGQPTITVGSVGLSGDFMGAFAGKGADSSGIEELVKRYERGDFDLVAVGRSLLQNPNWLLKVKEHRFSDIEAFDASSLQKLY